MGGGARVQIPSKLALHLYHAAEHKGEYVRLDWNTLEEQVIPTDMQKPQNPINRLMHGLPWKTTRSYRFSQRSHVNIQEARAGQAEIRDRAINVHEPERFLNAVDSRVYLGAHAKGRSSAAMLDHVLRGQLVYGMCGKKKMIGFWVSTDANPADHPTRLRPQPPPQPLPDWAKPYFESQPETGGPSSCADVAPSCRPEGKGCTHDCHS